MEDASINGLGFIALVVSVATLLIWRYFMGAHWLSLPEHLRKGLFRLYLVTAIPWVAWHGYHLFSTGRTYATREMARSFWWLLTVPVGGPIVLLLLLWVIAGFRKAHSNGGEARLATGPSSEPARPEVEAIFKKLNRLMTNEQAQVESLPEPLRSEVLSGANCDENIGAVGEFGRDPRNPIPVNGPLGELIYLSNLHTANSQHIMFHRLGSVAKVDAYETVSFDGVEWDIVFLDLYHPRQSRRAPVGYRILAAKERQGLLFGANEFVPDFPDQLQDAIADTYERLIGGRMRPRQVREAIDSIKFERPTHHQKKLASVLAMLKSKGAHKPAANFRGAGRAMATALMDPDGCWRDVCKLRDYDAPGPVATCEMAFARAAIVRHAIRTCQPEPIASEMLAGVDQYVAEAFASEESAEVLAYYEHERLSVIAPQAIQFYEENVFPLTQLADVFAGRLSVPGLPSIEIAPLFREVSAEADRLMKISSLLQRMAH